MSVVMALHKVVEVNPRLKAGRLQPDDIVSFVPMAAVSEQTKSIVRVEPRSYSDVKTGYTYFEEGDVIVAKITPCFENGKMAMVNNLPYSVAFGSTEFHVFRPGKQLLNSYLFHLLQSKDVQLNGAAQMKGAAGQKRISADYFKGLQIPLPPLPEQKRIAAILDAADAMRTKRRESLAQLDLLLQSTFLDMFGDPLTNPKGWDDSKYLGDIADIVSGITKGRKIKDSQVRDVYYLAVSNVQDNHLNLNIVKKIAATEKEITKYVLKENDLLLTEGGDPDKLGRGSLWANELPECIHQNHIFRVRLTSADVNPLYLNWIVASPRGKKYFLGSAKQTTGIASINMTQLKAFPMLMPPLDLQNGFATIVEAVEKQKDRLRAHLAELDTLFASLQHRAFNGEL